jgi:hypothetical protein
MVIIGRISGTIINSCHSLARVGWLAAGRARSRKAGAAVGGMTTEGPGREVSTGQHGGPLHQRQVGDHHSPWTIPPLEVDANHTLRSLAGHAFPPAGAGGWLERKAVVKEHRASVARGGQTRPGEGRGREPPLQTRSGNRANAPGSPPARSWKAGAGGSCPAWGAMREKSVSVAETIEEWLQMPGRCR